jgi:hypothetical protein
VISLTLAFHLSSFRQFAKHLLLFTLLLSAGCSKSTTAPCCSPPPPPTVATVLLVADSTHSYRAVVYDYSGCCWAETAFVHTATSSGTWGDWNDTAFASPTGNQCLHSPQTTDAIAGFSAVGVLPNGEPVHVTSDLRVSTSWSWHPGDSAHVAQPC